MIWHLKMKINVAKELFFFLIKKIYSRLESSVLWIKNKVPTKLKKELSFQEKETGDYDL